MPAGRIRRTKLSIVLVKGASATNSSVDTQELNGVLTGLLVKTGAVDSSATVQVDLIDQDGYTAYTKGSIAASTRGVYVLTADTKVPLAGKVTVKVTFSAAQTTADRTTEVVFLTDRG